MKARPHPYRRNIRYVNPRYQGGAALMFAAVIVATGTAFGRMVYLELGERLRTFALRGHYPVKTPYEVVREPLAWHIAGLLAGVLLLGTAAFLLFMWATRRGVRHVVETLRRSAEGDLSTPTGSPGLKEFVRLGKEFDGARADLLEELREVRSEAASLASGGIPPDEFHARWDGLKQRIRGIAP